MRIKENPFKVLGVTPENSIADIDEAKDDKCFEDEEREIIYEAARDMLSNPRKRLSAEARWFYDQRSHAFSSIDILHEFDEDDSMEEIAEFVQNIDKAYGAASDTDVISSLLEEINASRGEAGISQITDEDLVMNTLQEAIDEDFREAVSALFAHLSLSTIAWITNEVAKNTIEPSIGTFPKAYDEMVIVFIDCYYGLVKEKLESDGQSLLDDIEGAKAFEQVEELQPLFEKLRQFDFLAQPLQLYFQDKGEARKQGESQKIAESLRSLAVYFFNTKAMPAMSLAITKVCLQIFAENPELVERWKKDKELYEDILRDTASIDSFCAKLAQVTQESETLIVRKNGYEKTNAEQFQKHKDAWLKALREAAAILSGMNDEVQKECIESLASTYYSLATACTWAELWAYAYAIAKEGLPYAQKSGNIDLIRRYRSAMESWAKASEEIRAGEKRSHTTEPVEHNDEKVLRDQDTGCLLKLIGFIVAVGIIVAMFNSCGQSTKPSSQMKKVSAPISSSTQSQEKKPSSEEIQYAEPPVGSSRTLSRDEMHWVAREKIRLEKMRGLIQNNAGVEEFNKRIAHYNERGSSFQYYGNSWDNAQKEVEKHRSEIEAEIEKEVSDNGWDTEEAAASPMVSYGPSPEMVFRSFHKQITWKNYYAAYACLSPGMKDYVGSEEQWARGYSTTVSSVPVQVTMIEQTDSMAKLSFLLKAVDWRGNSLQKQTRYFKGICTMYLYEDGWKIDEVQGGWQ